MTRDQLLIKFPNSSESFIRANCAEDSRPAAVVESDPRAGALGPCQTKKADHGRFLVRVESVRKRLLDVDNLCEKYVVDCLRYSGIIPDDDSGTTEIKTTQRKAQKDEQEHTVITIERI